MSGAVVASCLIMLAIVGDTHFLLLSFAVIFGALAFRMRPPARHPVILLVMALLLVEVPREAGWLNVSRTSSTTSTTRLPFFVSTPTCKLGELATLSRGWRVVTELTGNVGEHARAADPKSRPDELVITARGEVEGGGLGCYLPLYKAADVEAEVEIHYRVDGKSQCAGTRMLRVDIDTTMTGIASCRDMRKQLGRILVRELEKLAAELSSRYADTESREDD
jgi:hypothetical protein